MVLDVNVLTSGWAIAGVIASFLVAVIALFLGINSSRQINKIRKDEKRERLINEIIEWAEDAAKSAISRQTKSRRELRKTELEYKVWREKGIYITGLVENSSVVSLLPLIKKIDNKLQQAIKVTVTELNKDKKKKAVPTEDIKKSENDIKEAVGELFKEIATIKSELLK